MVWYVGTDVLACAAEQFLCDDHKYCISASLVCNGFADCKDKSDEHQCGMFTCYAFV